MANFHGVVQGLRSVFNTGKTLDVNFRIQQLKALLALLEQNEDIICGALAEDLRKSKHEALLCETDILKNEIKFALNNIREWVKPQHVSKTLVTVFDKSFLHYQPYGVALILGAWNYPIQLSLLPLVGAVAAGNVCILKPSELAPASSKLLTELLPKYIDKDCYKVIPGGIPESTALLQEKYDIIFYTGGGNVGKIVHKAANEHLTPVVLELGGKSPTYIDGSCNIDVAVKRLMWGKFINAGQTCIAPDYLLCQQDVYDKVLNAAKKVIKEFFKDDPSKSPDFCRIITDRHFQRLKKLLSNGTPFIGGSTIDAEKYIEPTVLIDVDKNDVVMQEEIFGPILPVMKVKDEQEAIDIINEYDRPLALYVLSSDQSVIDKFMRHTTSGSFCCNDTMVFMGVPYLPFGGVGPSGCGRYHGKFSFDQFSHQKTVLVRDYNPIGEKLAEGRYPPYMESKLPTIRMLLAERQMPSCKYLPHFICFALGFATLIAIKAIAKAAGEDLPYPF